MALKIRLSRVGTKNEPHYRVVVAEERSRRDGDAVEQAEAHGVVGRGVMTRRSHQGNVGSFVTNACRAAAIPAATDRRACAGTGVAGPGGTGR